MSIELYVLFHLNSDNIDPLDEFRQIFHLKIEFEDLFLQNILTIVVIIKFNC